jgi:hypothetical protein
MKPTGKKSTKRSAAQPAAKAQKPSDGAELKPTTPLPQKTIRAAAPEALKPTAPAVPPGPSKPALSSPAPAVPKPAAPAALPKPSPAVTRPKAPQPNAQFSFEAAGAQRVSLCGDFNGWSPEATPMKRLEGGRWEIALVLRPGRYQYKFVVDGQWVHDPNAIANVPNLHGSLNSVLEVQG